MIEGTRPYKGKKEISMPTTESVVSSPVIEKTEANNTATNAANLDRRAWFSSLVPAFGGGLVKILRASNNLQDDLREHSSRVPPSKPTR